MSKRIPYRAVRNMNAGDTVEIDGVLCRATYYLAEGVDGSVVPVEPAAEQEQEKEIDDDNRS